MPLIANSLKTLSAALITAALIIATIVLGREILAPLALAGISCFVLVPVVRFLKRRCVPEAFAVGIVLFSTFGILMAASVGLSSQLLSLAADLPAYRTNVLDKVRSVVGSSTPTGIVSRAIDAVGSYRDMLDRELKLGEEATPPDAPLVDAKPEKKVEVVHDQSDSSAWYGLRILAEPLTQAALTFLFTLFLLMQYKDLRDRLVRVFGVDNMSETTAAMSDAGDRLTDLFTGQLILNASFGFVVGCTLLLLGVPNAPLWGTVAFVMRFVPFIGSYIAAVPPLLLAAAVDPGWTMALSTLALYVIGEPIMGQVMEPLILGKRAGLSPFAMVLATSFWTLAWGPIGLVLAAPITLVLVVLGRYIPNLEFITVLLGDEPPLSQQQDLYHRFLSADVYGARAQIEEAQDHASVGAVLDTTVFPALKLAARDRRRGRLDAEAALELEETIAEVAAEPERSQASDEADTLIIPVRGRFDVLAGQFIVAALNREHPNSASMVGDESGLTVLSSLAEIRPQNVEQIVFVTAVGLAEKLIALMVTKAQQLFPESRIVVLDLTKPEAVDVDDAAKVGVQTFRKFSEFVVSMPRPEERDCHSTSVKRNALN